MLLVAYLLPVVMLCERLARPINFGIEGWLSWKRSVMRER
jgi:hypothetical protein